MFSGQAASRFLCVLGSQFQICRSNPDRPTLGSVYSPDPISHGQGMGLLAQMLQRPLVVGCSHTKGGIGAGQTPQMFFITVTDQIQNV